MFTVPADRGPVDFGAWGGACAQPPLPCPFEPGVAPDDCGDPDQDGETTATDALRALQSAVGGLFCPECFCDINGDGTVTTQNALQLLLRAIGAFAGPPPACPNCPSQSAERAASAA